MIQNKDKDSVLNKVKFPHLEHKKGLPSGSSGKEKNLPANGGDTRDLGLKPGLGRSPEEKMATHSSILAGKIPWTEDFGGLQPMGSQKVRHNWAQHSGT